MIEGYFSSGKVYEDAKEIFQIVGADRAMFERVLAALQRAANLGVEAQGRLKHWECTDCAGGEKYFPCRVWFEYADAPPTECPYGNGTECKWVLKEQVT